MDTVAINKLQYLLIGQQGENAANNIPIDMTEWVNEFPNANFYLLFKAYNTQSPLPMVTTYDAETHIMTWTPTLDATQNAGVGYTEIRALDTGMLKKSRIIPTTVENSVTGVEGGSVPEPYEDWVNLVLSYKDAAEDAQEAAETAQGKAEDAQEAAETAQGKAEDAQEAAETAQGKAEDAQEAAETAQGKAEDAQEAAETAQGKAEDAQEAAETAQAAAESWATGGSSGTPSATNNAKYYSEQASGSATSANNAKNAAVAAKDALEGANASASTLSPGSSATAALTWTSGTANFVFGIPAGVNASIVSTATAWQNSQSGTVVPTGTWETTQPITPQGYYLWTRYTLTWNTGNTTVMYTISRMGVDGSGSVVSVKMNDQTFSPDAQGIVDLGTVITDISGKLDLNQGSGNSGKFMQVGNDGALAPADLPLGIDDTAGSGTTDKTWSADKLVSEFSAKANTSSVVIVTAAAGSWTSATPPTQTIPVTGVTASNNITVGIASTATQAQYEAAAAAKLLCTAQATGEITITCYGDEPSVNIPLAVQIVG